MPQAKSPHIDAATIHGLTHATDTESNGLQTNSNQIGNGGATGTSVGARGATRKAWSTYEDGDPTAMAFRVSSSGPEELLQQSLCLVWPDR